MQDDNSKIMTMCFVATGALAYFVVQVLFENMSVSFAPVMRFHNIEAVRHGLPIFFGLVTFGALQLSAKIRTWADECIAEVRKVVWPSRKDTMGMTVVCCVMVVFLGISLGLFDYGSKNLIKVFVNLSVFH